jgi:hypothetical protein
VHNVTFVYLPLACVLTASVDALLTSDRWCCDSHAIWNPFSSFVKEYCYSAQEMADMHFMSGHANRNSQEACRLYAEHYPQCRIPSHKLFNKLHQWLRKSGSSAPQESARGRPQSAQTPDMEVRELRRVEEDPRTSVRKIAATECIGVPPCLENPPWTITLLIPHPASASPRSSWPLCKGGVLPVASRKMCCKHTVYG